MRVCFVLLLGGCTTFVASRDARRASLGDAGTEFTPYGAPVNDDDGGGGGLSRLGVIDAVGIGNEASCVVDDDGQLSCWAISSIPDWEDSMPGGGPWTDVNVGWAHACAIRENGALDCWGRESSFDPEAAQPGLDPAEERFRAGPYDNVRAGIDRTCAGNVTSWECWGASDQWVAAAPDLSNVVDLDVHTGGCAIIGGSVTCWGGTSDLFPDDALFDGITNARQIKVGRGGVCVRDAVDDLWCSQYSEQARRYEDVERIAQSISGFTRPRESFSLCWTVQGDIECTGPVEYQAREELPAPGPYRAVATDQDFVCGILRDEGQLRCFGPTSSPHRPR